VCLNFPSEAFKFTGIREEISSASKLLGALGVSWADDIYKEAEGMDD
jgi:hypothetical protein